MHTTSHCRRLALALALSLWCSPLLGQWVVGAEIGADRFWGGTAETTGGDNAFRPYRPTTFGVGAEYQAGRFSYGIRLQYASASLGLEGPDGVIVANGILSMYNVSPELIYRITSLGSVNQLRLHAGPIVELWGAEDLNSEARVGAQGGLSLAVPLGGSFEGLIAAGLTVIRSPFGTDELIPEFEPKLLWRRSFRGGLQYRL